MSIKRRGFLAMLGAVVTAPALPMAASGMSSGVTGLAVTHAQKYPLVSAIGLSRRLDMPLAEAQKLLIDLSRKGLVGQVQTCGTGPMHAASKVFKPSPDSLIRLAQARNAAKKVRADSLAKVRDAKCQMQVDLQALLRHLQEICTRNGMTLHPRALKATQ